MGETPGTRQAHARGGAGDPLPFALGGLVLAALWALGLFALTPVFAPGPWLGTAVTVSGVILVATGALRALRPRLRAGAALIGALTGVSVWVAWSLVSTPVVERWASPAGALHAVQREIIVGSAPLTPSPALADLMLCVVIAAATASALLLAGARWLLAAGLVAVPLFLVAPAFIARSVDGAALLGAGLLLAALAWLGSPRRSWGALVAAGAAVAVAAGVVAVAPATRDRVWNDATVLSPVARTVPDVTLALAEDLRRRNGAIAFSYETGVAMPVRFTLATLSDFSGGVWHPQQQIDPGSDVARALAGPAGAENLFDGGEGSSVPVARVTIDGLVSEWLPLPAGALQVRAAGGSESSFAPEDWFWVSEAATGRSERAVTRRGDAYQVAYWPVPTSAALGEFAGTLPDSLASEPEHPAHDWRLFETPDGAPEGLRQYLELPDGATAPPAISEAARDAAGGEQNPLLAALTLQDWFRDGSFTYDESAPYSPGTDADDPYALVEAFLAERRGFCVHFASAFAVMARDLGIPTRIAVGYAPPSASGRGAVRGSDLHAWPEIYVEAVGWIAFEPTPGGAGYRAETDEEVPATPDEPEADDLEEQAEQTEAPEPEAEAPPEQQPEEEAPVADRPERDGVGLGALLGWIGGAAALLALAALPALVRAARRLARLRAIGRGDRPAARAWAEIEDTARDLGLARASSPGAPGDAPRSAPRATTPEAVAEHLLERLDGSSAERDSSPSTEAGAALRLLADAAVRERYGPAADGSDPGSGERIAAELVRARAGLRSSAPGADRLRATLAPRSVLHRGSRGGR